MNDADSGATILPSSHSTSAASTHSVVSLHNAKTMTNNRLIYNDERQFTLNLNNATSRQLLDIIINNLLLNVSVKEFWKSVTLDESMKLHESNWLT